MFIIRVNKPSPPSDKPLCPDCGAQLVFRTGKYGVFFGCSRFPRCRFHVRRDFTTYDYKIHHWRVMNEHEKAGWLHHCRELYRLQGERSGIDWDDLAELGDAPWED